MSSTSLPPAKRQRTENEDASITRSEIWHDDGSVVLQAENIQFRVHWSVLALHSTFFQGMRGLPQPPDQETVEGCPLIELPDSPEDFKYLLDALYHPAVTNQKALPLPMIASFLRIGRKYEFKELLDIAVDRLTFENPTSLKEYDALTAACGGEYAMTRIVHSSSILFDVLTLARENDIMTVLPCAYYRVLMAYDQSEIFDGVPREDETSATLSPADQRILVLAREKILKAQYMKGNTLDWAVSSQECCREWLHAVTREFLISGVLDPLTPAQHFPGSCESCQADIKESMAQGRENIWRSLPDFFELPAWSDLKNDL
ncbi:hypothetical protein C8J57DRAFT_1167172 [Mycena rebaudengoi]|nr:hypothetical protein C8J57DRAFT_1167172 [Mycena rebaudengoi]